MAFTRKYGRKRYGRKKVYKKRAFMRRRGIRTNKRGAKIYYFKRTRVEVFNVLDNWLASCDGLLSHNC